MACSRDFWRHKLKYVSTLTEFAEHGIDIEKVSLPGKCWEHERELHGEENFTEKLAPDPVLDEVLSGQFYS